MCSTEHGKGYWSSEGSAECDLATDKYFMEEGTPFPCPEGVNCDEPGTTTESMQLEDGWFKFGENVRSNRI